MISKAFPEGDSLVSFAFAVTAGKGVAWSQGSHRVALVSLVIIAVTVSRALLLHAAEADAQMENFKMFHPTPPKLVRGRM